MVRGLGLSKLMAESNLVTVVVNNVENEQVLVTSIELQPWYSEIVHFLRDAAFLEEMT